MKNTIKLLILVLLIGANSFSQNKSFEEKAKVLKLKIEQITLEERALLKEQIKDIKQRLNNQEITPEVAQKLKEDAAQKSAKQIQIRVSEVEKKLKDLVNNKVDKTIYKDENSKRFSIAGFDIDYTERYTRRHHRKYWDRRTHTYTVLSVGLNNLVSNNDIATLDNTNFDFWKSRYLEIGTNSKTRVFNNGGFFYFDFGFSLIYNVLRANKNQYFEADGNTTNLKVHPETLDKSKFKNIQIIVPAFLEMDFRRAYRDNENRLHFRRNRGLRMGFGGFVGLNLKTKQILKYNMNNVKVKDVKKGDLNVNNFLYGLNAFIGHRDTSIFVRYYLNPIFTNNTINQNDMTLGLRFDW